MKFHIVGNGESVEDILKGYDLTIEELKNENKHIRIWNNLIPGTKLKIPILSEAIIEDINTIEPFIEEYYPKIKIEEENQIIEEFNEDNNNIVIDNVVDEVNYNNEIVLEEENVQDKDNVVNEENKISNNDKKGNPIYYRYVYPQPYYYRPIIYVIPRK